jgi:hypothetical protein
MEHPSEGVTYVADKCEQSGASEIGQGYGSVLYS